MDAARGAGPPPRGDELAIGIAKQVLQLGEGGQVEAVLSVLGEAITRATPFAKQKRAYLQLARLIHPDKCREERANAAFMRLQAAHEVLTDETRRAAYDRQRQLEKRFAKHVGGAAADFGLHATPRSKRSSSARRSHGRSSAQQRFR